MEVSGISSSPYPAPAAQFNAETFDINQVRLAQVQTLLSTPDQSSKDGSDQVSLSFNEIYKALNESTRSMVDKINALLKAKLPNGVQSLTPDQVTPEATADRIVQGSTASFDDYAKSNPDLNGEELLKRFLDNVRSGISQGYDDASKTLEAIGAFETEGVKAGIEKTRALIDEKLKAFELAKAQELGIGAPSSSQNTSTELIAEGGGLLLGGKAKLSITA